MQVRVQKCTAHQWESSNEGGFFKGSKPISMIGHKNRIYAPTWKVLTPVCNNDSPVSSWSSLPQRPFSGKDWTVKHQDVKWLGKYEANSDLGMPSNSNRPLSTSIAISSGSGPKSHNNQGPDGKEEKGSATTATTIECGLLLWRP